MFLKEEDKKVEKLLHFNSLKDQEINQVFQSKNSFKNGVFIVKFKDSLETKFLITFSKKLKLNKPQKNHLKRQIKDIIRHSDLKFPKLNFHIVLILINFKQDEFYPELKENIKLILKNIQNVEKTI